MPVDLSGRAAMEFRSDPTCGCLSFHPVKVESRQAGVPQCGAETICVSPRSNWVKRATPKKEGFAMRNSLLDLIVPLVILASTIGLGIFVFAYLG